MVKGEPDFLNFFKTPENWELVGEYGIPKMKGCTLKPTSNISLVGANEAYQIPQEERKKTMVHFYLADYLIERFWTQADRNANFLIQFKACFSPDFSQYTDMPRALCIFNQYRKLWVSKYWEEKGMKVIPVVNWSDKESYSYCFDGLPQYTTVAISTLGTINDTQASYLWSCGFEKAIERLEPKNIILYGKYPEYLKTHSVDCEVIHIPHQMHERFKKLRKRNTKEMK